MRNRLAVVAVLAVVPAVATQEPAVAARGAATQDAQKKDTFKKAWGACLEGRGYSVK